MKRVFVFFFLLFIGMQNAFSQTYIYDDTVPFNWIEIENTGNQVSWANNCTAHNNNDDFSVVSIGFNFKFGSHNFNQVRIMSNGLLQFGNDTGLHRQNINTALPNTSNPPAYQNCPRQQADLFIAPYWDDLIPTNGGHVYYQTLGTAPDRIFVVEWKNVRHYPNIFFASYTFEVILYEKTGDIKFQYNSSSTDGSSATIGVEISNNDYTQYSYNSSTVGTGKAILFYNLYYPWADYHFDKCFWEENTHSVIDSARGFDGIPYDVSTVNDGIVCRSVNFLKDGITDYLSLPEKVLDGANDFSVLFWIKTTYRGNQSIVSAANATVSWGNEFLIFLKDYRTMEVYVKARRITATIGNIADNVWHQIAVVRTGSTVRIYVDGSLVYTTNRLPSGALRVDPGGLIIGQEQDRVGGRFDRKQDCQGFVDELVFYRRVLSGSEISSIYNNQKTGNNFDGTARTCLECGPNGDWRMDECEWNGTFGEVEDSSGNNLNGTAKGNNPDGKVAEIYENEYICNSGLFRGQGYMENGAWHQARYYIEVPDNDLLSPLETDNQMTITGWFNTNANSGTIISKSGSNREYRVYVAGGDLKVDFYNANNSAFSTTIHTSVNNGSWHFFAVMAEITGSPGSQTLTVKTYFDGNQGATSQFANFNNYQNKDSNLYIGAMSWSNGNLTDYFNGKIDEIKIFRFSISGNSIDDIYQNENAKKNYDGTDRNCKACKPVAEWRMDECEWDGTTGEIVDSTGHGHDGTSYSGANTDADAILCRSGLFDNSSGDVQYGIVPDSDELSPHAGSHGEMTLMAWVKVLSYPNSSLQGRVPIVAKGDRWQWEYALYIYDWHAVGFSTWNPNGRGYGEPAGGSIPLNEWHHLAGVIKKGQYVRIYMDGQLIDEKTALVGDTKNRSSPLYFARRGRGNHYFNGFIDEVKLYDKAMSQSQIQEIYNNERSGFAYSGSARTCQPCSNIAYFEITHDGNAIACYPERIHIKACDSGGNTITNYSGQITLTTSTNHGTWYASYTGVVNDDPPHGTLTDNTADDGQATYQFDVSDAGEITLFLRDEHLETLTIYVTDGTADSTGHNSGNLVVKPSGFIFDTIDNQISGKDFSVTVKAIGEDPATGNCTLLDYDGTKTIKAYVVYQNPSSGSTDLKINGTNVSSSGTNISLNFSNGVCTFTGNYPDAGQISIKFEDNNENLTGDSNLFVVKPFGFYVYATGNPGASDASGAVFKKAGENFELTVKAVCWQSADDNDNDGVPDSGADLSDNDITPNYSGSADLTSSLVAPSGGASGTFNPSAITLSGGQGSNSSVSFSEVGIIQVDAKDADYLGAGSITGTSGNIGRFIPNGFKFDGITQNPACSSLFTYGGQNFTVDVSMSAINTHGDITQNYTDDFAKLDFSDLSFNAMINATTSGDGNLNVTSTTVSFANGQSSFSLSCNYNWSDEHNPENIAIKIVATDSDGVTGNGLSNYVSFKYGRLRVENGYAPSADQNLTLNIFAEYYKDGDYILNSDDSCTSYTDSDISLSNYSGNLNSGETAVISYTTIAGGSGSVTLSAPGVGNEGTVDLILTAPYYMHFAVGRATFGIYRGNDGIISWEEIF